MGSKHSTFYTFDLVPFVQLQNVKNIHGVLLLVKVTGFRIFLLVLFLGDTSSLI